MRRIPVVLIQRTGGRGRDFGFGKGCERALVWDGSW